jgi:polyhomeotic-like protein 1
MANQQQQAIQHQAIQQQFAQIAQLQQQQLLQNAQAQNAQLMASQQGNIQQVVLQQQQMPTVTVTSSANLQQLPTHLTQQGIMTKAGTQQIFHMTQPVSSHSASIATSMANSNPIITSIAGAVTADTSNAIIGPLSSPQTLLQPPQNPLIAMSTLSASPMAITIQQKEKVDASSGDSSKVSTSTATSIASSPLKRSIDQENDSKNNEGKKQTTDSGTDARKDDKNHSSSSPSVKNQPGTPNSTSKAQANAANNSPLATQNGEIDGKKTTSNGTGSSTPLLKNELPKAMVKPNVLTHVIEGYVIQESSEPFPVTRQRYSEKENDEPPKKKQAVEDSKSENLKVNGESSSSVSSSTPIQSPSDMVACEQCGKQEMRSKLKRKKFCSVNCARVSKNSSIEGSPAVASNGDDRSVAASPSLAEKSSKTDANESSSEVPSIEEHVMMKWSVTQVCDFIKNLPGCSDYAEDFALQEIDGQALLLLKENHLVSAMGMKLGPALKIVNKIESMRVSKEGEQSENSMDQSSSGQ